MSSRASRASLRSLKPKSFRRICPASLQGSPEDSVAAQGGATSAMAVQSEEPASYGAPAAMGKQEALAQFSVDLTERARKGEIDPIVGRDAEIRQIIDILMRRRQNNPILTGEAGVGKTAVVEGFALRIAAGDVPPVAQGRRRCERSISGCCRPARVEGRIRESAASRLSTKCRPRRNRSSFSSTKPTRSSAPAVLRGRAMPPICSSRPSPAEQLRTIAATTWAEYKKYLKKTRH